ncbi:MAG: hypothetical protein Q7T19_00670 [Caulobacter sp.]|nr:hypothetical protein [Caulobacter sp.]
MAGLTEDDAARVAYEGLARTFLLLADEADARSALDRDAQGNL